MNREEAHLALMEWIEAQSTLVLATVGAEGGPLATPLFYLPEERLTLSAGLTPAAGPSGTPGGLQPAGGPAVTPGGEGGRRLPALFWLSSPSSRHSRAVAADRRAAVSIPGNTSHWSEIRGVQLEGEVDLVEDPQERQKQLTRYVERFALDGQHEARIASSGLYRFTPLWARYLDNRAGGLGRWEF